MYVPRRAHCSPPQSVNRGQSAAHHTQQSRFGQSKKQQTKTIRASSLVENMYTLSWPDTHDDTAWNAISACECTLQPANPRYTHAGSMQTGWGHKQERSWPVANHLNPVYGDTRQHFS